MDLFGLSGRPASLCFTVPVSQPCQSLLLASPASSCSLIPCGGTGGTGGKMYPTTRHYHHTSPHHWHWSSRLQLDLGGRSPMKIHAMGSPQVFRALNLTEIPVRCTGYTQKNMTTHTPKTGTDLRTDLSDTPGRRERFGLLVIFQILSIFHSTHLYSCSDLPTMEESSIPGSVATENSAHLSTSPSSGDGERSFRRPVPWSELPCSRNATICHGVEELSFLE